LPVAFHLHVESPGFGADEEGLFPIHAKAPHAAFKILGYADLDDILAAPPDVVDDGACCDVVQSGCFRYQLLLSTLDLMGELLSHQRSGISQCLTVNLLTSLLTDGADIDSRGVGSNYNSVEMDGDHFAVLFA